MCGKLKQKAYYSNTQWRAKEKRQRRCQDCVKQGYRKPQEETACSSLGSPLEVVESEEEEPYREEEAWRQSDLDEQSDQSERVRAGGAMGTTARRRGVF